MADIRAMIKELADWDRQCFPLGGGNMIDLLVKHGLVSADDASQMYRDVMVELGEKPEDSWPPALWQETSIDGPAKQAWAARDDREIPF